MRFRSVAVLTALSLLSTVVAPAAIAPPVEAAPPRPDIDLDALAEELPLTLELGVDLPQHVLGGDGEVFVTGDDELLVIDLEGHLVGLVEDLAGAGPMTRSPDGESLFVGLRDHLEVVMLDVQDLDEVWAWDLPARPRSLVATDDLLHVGVGQTGAAFDRTALVTIPADEEATPLVRSFPHTPLLARDQAGLVIGHAGVSPARVSRRSIDGEVLQPPLERSVGGQLRDVKVDRATGAVWIAGSGQAGPSYSVHELDPETLATTRSITLGAYPNAVAPLHGGQHLAAGRSAPNGSDDVTIHRLDDDQGATPIAAYELPGQLVAQGLSVTDDGTLAMLTRPTGGGAGGWLTLLPNPHRGLPELVVHATAPIAGEPIGITGVLRAADGAPVIGADISVLDPRGGQVHTTTDASGAFRAVLPATALGDALTTHIVFPGDAERQPVVVERTFTPRRGETRPYLLDGTFVAGQPGLIRGRVLGEHATVRPHVPVTIEVDGGALGSTTSDADGWFTHPLTVPVARTVRVTAAVAQDATHLAGSSTWEFEAIRDVPYIRIDAVAGTARSPVGLTGRVHDGASRPVIGRSVEVSITDDHGVTVTRQPQTDPEGRWTTTFTPRHGGSHAITARVRQDDRFAASHQTRDVQIAKAPTSTTLASLPATVDHGASLTLTGRLTVPSGASLDLVAVDLATGTERRVARAQVDSTGRLTRQVTARANTRYEARFRGDAAHAASSARRTVKVRATVTAKVSGHDRTVDGVPSFPYGARPTVTGRVRSADPAGRVHLQLQQRRDGAWVTAAGWYARPDTEGRITSRTPFRLVDGRYRVRISTAETPANLQGHSPWTPLRVRS